MIRTVAELRSALADRRGSRVALVSTLGTLHEGHRALVRRAQEEADTVVVSMFRNPLRFKSAAERDAYPAHPDVDEALLDEWGIDLAFAPEVDELLPEGAVTRVTPGFAGQQFEGRTRPAYFDGVLTVEAQLMNIVRPDIAVYGERDPQRVVLVRRMVRDLFFDVRVVTAEVVRHPSGLPVSSRIALLDDEDLHAAATISRALEAVAGNAVAGLDAAIAAAQGTLMGEPRLSLDYFAVVDPTTFAYVPDDHHGPALAVIGALVGGHRFVDNTPVYIP